MPFCGVWGPFFTHKLPEDKGVELPIFKQCVCVGWGGVSIALRWQGVCLLWAYGHLCRMTNEGLLGKSP